MLDRISFWESKGKKYQVFPIRYRHNKTIFMICEHYHNMFVFVWISNLSIIDSSVCVCVSVCVITCVRARSEGSVSSPPLLVVTHSAQCFSLLSRALYLFLAEQHFIHLSCRPAHKITPPTPHTHADKCRWKDMW